MKADAKFRIILFLVAMVSSSTALAVEAAAPPSKAAEAPQNGPTMIGKPAYGFLVPVVEGNESMAVEFVKGNGAANAEAFAASRARIGVTRERVWAYGGGKMLLVVWESAELDQVMPKWLASEDPFDVAFLESVQEFSGMDLRATDAPAPNELVLDWTAAQ